MRLKRFTLLPLFISKERKESGDHGAGGRRGGHGQRQGRMRDWDVSPKSVRALKVTVYVPLVECDD